MLSSKRQCLPVIGLVIQSQNFSLGSPWLKSHYDSLGVTPHATQTDIKTAYYKLSKMYHPDKNKGSDSALDKFRDITTAYEVLGNFKLRKLYDKGILHTAASHYPSQEEAVVDDATTKFYKSRMNRSKPPTPTGRTPIYDFDEWSRSHYGASFARKAAAREKFMRKEANILNDRRDIQTELCIFGIAFCVLLFCMTNYKNAEDYDVPLVNEKQPIKVDDSLSLEKSDNPKPTPSPST